MHFIPANYCREESGLNKEIYIIITFRQYRYLTLLKGTLQADYA